MGADSSNLFYEMIPRVQTSCTFYKTANNCQFQDLDYRIQMHRKDLEITLND